MDDEARFEGVLASFGPLSAERLEHLPRAVGLEPAVREATTALSRGATVLVSGKPGVGKTALIREVQRTIRDGPCHPELLGTQIYVSSVAQLLAGTVYAGWWQTKLAALTRDVALARSNGVRPLIWLTDFVNLLRECRGDKGKSIGEDLMPRIGEIDTPLSAAGAVRGEDYDRGRFRLRQFCCRECGTLFDAQVACDDSPRPRRVFDLGRPAA